PPCGQARAGRRLPRPVRRVLRDRACAHGARRAGTRAGRLPGLAARATQARPVAGASRGTRRRAAVPRDRLRRVPHAPWHGRRRQPGPRPHALRQSHHRRGGPLSDEHPDHRGLGRRRAGAQTGQPHARFRTGARRGRRARDRRLPGEPRMTRPTVEPGLRSEPARDEGASQLQQAWAVPRGIRYWTEVNNTQIGVWYAATAFFFFLFAGVLALLMRTQLAVPGNELLEPGTYNQFMTMHGSAMMFLFAVPILEAVAIILLPDMLGARDLPFPRLSAFGFWSFLFGGLFVAGSVLFG